eukprot:TRINITY_DN35112_c0_g1_i1.p1 TRINITY_DN35112_c0_g1~~TRINITY_DN35112_c0_g1_i1.p1  ORF type:complete len:678 (-),score=190.08 TRINITY_DN35112_c0_g1_i1:23-2056(-)
MPSNDGYAAGSVATKAKVSPEVMKTFERDIEAMSDSIRLLLCNKVAEADKRLHEAGEEAAKRDFDFSKGEHDPRGAFAFVGAIMSLIHGLASLENDQLDTVLQRVWAADELLAADGDWAGRTVLRGLCLLVAGVVEIAQMSIPQGVFHILRSWLWLRSLESEALNFEGHERSVVRSTALLALGVFGLLVAMLPPSATKAAGWLTGFKGGYETAIGRLRECWQEGGIQAPFAGLILVGVAVDVSSFLGQLEDERAESLAEAQKVLDWAVEKYPGSFFFEILRAGHSAAVRDLPGALETLQQARKNVEDLPAFVFLSHVRRATLECCSLEWSKAAESWRDALETHRKVGRRAVCPTLAMNSYLCYRAAGQTSEATEMLNIALTYKKEKKKWSPIDKLSLEQAETARLVEEGEKEGNKSAADEEGWFPMLVLLQKVCMIYRGVHFMSDDMRQRLLDVLQSEAARCKDDVEGRSLAVMIQAEAMRQMERWTEALEYVEDVRQMSPDLTKKARDSGCLQVVELVAAYAHHARGNVAGARDAIARLDGLGSDHFFKRAVDFKATHLKRLIGMTLQDEYIEINVSARDAQKLTAEVPDGDHHIEWDIMLDEYSISGSFRFVGESTSQELAKWEKHQADAGPMYGDAQLKGPGTLLLVFDNSFSMLRSKTLHCRLQPSSFKLKFV